MLKYLVLIIMSATALLLSDLSSAARYKHDRHHQNEFVLSISPQRIYFGSTNFYYYPNHLIIPSHYNKKSIHDLARLSRHLGWNHVYLLPSRYQYGVPSHLNPYLIRTFRHAGIGYSYYRPYQGHFHSPYYYQHYNEPRSGFYFQFRF